jgi:hypothetical protein
MPDVLSGSWVQVNSGGINNTSGTASEGQPSTVTMNVSGANGSETIQLTFEDSEDAEAVYQGISDLMRQGIIRDQNGNGVGDEILNFLWEAMLVYRPPEGSEPGIFQNGLANSIGSSFMDLNLLPTHLSGNFSSNLSIATEPWL